MEPAQLIPHRTKPDMDEVQFPGKEAGGIRVLLLLTQMEAGGAQKAAIKLTKGLETQGYQVTIATMYDKASYVPAYRKEYGVEIVDLQMKDASKQGSLLARAAAGCRGLLRLWRLMRREQYDVLLTFTHYSNFLGPAMGWMAGIPVRVSSQRSLLNSYPAWIRGADRIITNSPLVDKMTTVSEAVRSYAIQEENIHPSKVVAIHTGIDIQAYQTTDDALSRSLVRSSLGLDNSHVAVIVIARFHPVKGHAYLLEAIPSILDKAPHCRFLLVGEGPLEGELLTRIDELKLADKVFILGVRNDVPRLLAASDIMVLPSLEEGLPNVILEGMAAGLPVVATSMGGIPELVIDRTTGILIPPGNAKTLAESTLELVNDRQLAKEMGIQGQMRVMTTFTASQTTRQYADLFAQLLARKGKRP